jgi:hypothetical protein
MQNGQRDKIPYLFPERLPINGLCCRRVRAMADEPLSQASRRRFRQDPVAAEGAGSGAWQRGP